MAKVVGSDFIDIEPIHEDMMANFDAKTNPQLDKFKEAARNLEIDDDPERFKGRLGKPVKDNPVEKPE